MSRLEFFYRALVVLVAVQLAYSLYWAAHDISARLGLWPDTDQAQAFVNSLTVVQETLFFSHVAMNAVVLFLVLKRRWVALPAFVLSFVLDRSEWVIMGGNTLFSSMVDVDVWAMFSFTLQGAIIALLVTLVFEEQLK
jgi:hypothetical protein